MKLTNRVIERVFGVLRQIGKLPMPMRLSWMLKDFMEEFEPIVVRMSKTLLEMQDRYADRDADGKVVQNTDPATGKPIPGSFVVTDPFKTEAVRREIDEMYALETNFPNLSPIPLSWFPEDLAISPEHIRTLKDIINKDE